MGKITRYLTNLSPLNLADFKMSIVFRFNSKSFLLLLGSIVVFSCSTTKQIDKTFTESSVFEQGFSGLAVYDPAEGRMVYERNADKYFTPASNTKLFTFYTGLKILGDSVPALRYIVRQDSLIFTGTGDPSFLNPNLPHSKIYNFLKSRSEDLYYLIPTYEEKYFGPGWSWDDYNSYYSVERTALPVYGNSASFTFSPGLPPTVRPLIFSDSIVQLEPLSNTPRIIRNRERNIFSFSPGIKPKAGTQEVPIRWSQELLVEILSDTLKKEVKILRETPGGFEYARKVYSVPVDSMYKRMMEVSDNFIAEQILLLAAGEIRDTLSTKIAIDHMLKNHLQDLPDEPKWVDGSGLSRYNLATPRTMVKLLTKIKAEIPQERLFNMLATGGVSGTIKNNYLGDPPYIFAKTGTLRNNHSLSGYLRARSGKVLIFSFMNSNYVVPTTALKEQMEIILRKLYEEN